jgi:hypothetical protein
LTFGKKLRTIGSRLTINEPQKLRRNVRNFFCKSKSLTDSALHKINPKLPAAKQHQHQNNTHKSQLTDSTRIISTVVGSYCTNANPANNNNESASESSKTNSTIGLAVPTKLIRTRSVKESGLSDLGYAKRLRRRTSLRNQSLDNRPVRRQYSARRDSSLEVLVRMPNSTSTDLNEIDTSSMSIVREASATQQAAATTLSKSTPSNSMALSPNPSSSNLQGLFLSGNNPNCIFA